MLRLKSSTLQTFKSTYTTGIVNSTSYKVDPLFQVIEVNLNGVRADEMKDGIPHCSSSDYKSF
jgi:hypothetical protein